MLVISTWFGRLGNNIIQIINAIYIAEKNNHKYVNFHLKHNMFKTNSIEIDIGTNKENEKKVVDTFFYIKRFNIYDLEPYKMKQIYQKYIRPIIKIDYKEDNNDSDTIYFHFRGGDIFKENTHKAYVQPPLSYYKNIIKDYKNVVLVCEDKKNPCIEELLKLNNVIYESNSMQKDLNILSNVSNLGLCFGTFSLLLYLINTNLKNLYVPYYFIDEQPKGCWGEKLNLHIIQLPGYIKVGEWKYNDETKRKMFEY
tara:strand:+ start:14795 stop:15556 length:762 start_codon:yes stop_codon:yes gene_type:complete